MTMNRFRACWVTQVPLGCDVTRAMWTQRVSTSMKKRTYRGFRKEGVNSEEVCRQNGLRLSSNEVFPAQ